MGSDFYDVGSKLAVPGVESTMEYGDASAVKFGRIPGAVLINDRSILEAIRLEQIDGIHSTPAVRDSRQPNSSRHGERAGQMLYEGRTVGLTGHIEAGSIPAVRDAWTRFSSQFGTRERDLLIHPPSEVPLYVNEFLNPSFSRDNFAAWPASGAPVTLTGGVTDGVELVGNISAVPAGAGAQVILNQSIDTALMAGKDLYLSMRVKIHSVGAGSVASASLVVIDGGTSTVLTPVTQSSPVTGTWYELSTRVLSSSLKLAGSLFVGISVTLGAAATYVIRVDRAMAVILDPAQANPPGYFDGSFSGFEWAGRDDLAKSYGPCYAVNQIQDASIVISDPDLSLTYWRVVPATGVTINFDARTQVSWRGSHTGGGYMLATKDATATARTIELTSIQSILVAPGRTYRWSSKVKALTKPATGALKLRIAWYTISSTLISTSDSSIIAVGINDYSIQATAPALAVYATASIVLEATTTSSGVLELMWADPFFADVSDFDPDEFFGLEVFESSNISTQAVSSRKFIPRPFLLRQIRQATENKSDEQQPDRRYKRSFTMGMRASDPRIYTFDERRAQIALSGSPKFVARQAPSDFTLETAALPVPTGYTYEGHYITHPGTGTTYKWSQDITPSPNKRPLNGVGVKAWPTGSNNPTQDLKTRMYRSAEAYTYGEPRVILGGAPAFVDSYADPSNRNMVMFATGSPGSQTIYYNDLTILLKRIASGTWLELRWNSMSKAYKSTEPNAPYAFELWCSHNAAGTPATTTRLATWDYTSYDSSDGKYPFRPSIDPMWLTSWILGNVVYWELWSNYPHPINTSGRIESGSFTIPAGLISIVGSAQAGSAGWSMKIAGGATAFPYLASGSPTMHYFESSDASLPPVSKPVPVIGSIDTPQKIELRGNIVDPIISISAPEFDGYPARTSVARFIGTITDASPITVDLSGSELTVTDSLGVDRYDMVVTGSSFAPLRPGVNYVTLQAKSWGTYPAHMITSWRDALKSG